VDRAIYAHFFATLFAQLLVIGATGGLRSPLMPLLVVGGLVTRLMLGRRFDHRILLVSLGSALLMAILPSRWSGPTIAAPYWQVLAVGSLCSAAFQTRDAILRMTEVALCSGEQLVRLREQSLEEAQERLLSLQSISARLAHELKNPLSAIKGLVQLHQRSEADLAGREQLAVVASEIARVELILRDYLSYSRPLDDLRPERIALDQLISDVVAVLSGRAQGAGVRLREDNAVAVVYGDPRRLKEALINLVANAIEATPVGGSVVVGVRDYADRAEIFIRDTGCGITPEVLARIGTPFFTTRADGTGLGVVLARNVVVQHGGSVDFDSQPGLGTTVAVKLPYQCKQEARLHGHRAAG
jgi:signal transduction histidine kinase